MFAFVMQHTAVATYSRRSTRTTRSSTLKSTEPVTKKVKQVDLVSKEEKKMEADRKRQQKQLEAAAKKEEKKLEAQRKKELKELEAIKKQATNKNRQTKKIAAGKQKERKQVAKGKNKRQKVDPSEEAYFDELEISPEEEVKRFEHQNFLENLRKVAEAEFDKLKSTVFIQPGTNVAAVDPVFPDDPIDIFNSQSLPLRLSQEERNEMFENFNNFQRIIYKKCGDRMKQPRKYISPFLIQSSRPRVPLERALALREKIQSSTELHK